MGSPVTAETKLLKKLGGQLRKNGVACDVINFGENEANKERLETLLEAAAHNRGEDVSFLERWGYNAEQKAAIHAAIEAVAD